MFQLVMPTSASEGLQKQTTFGRPQRLIFKEPQGIFDKPLALVQDADSEYWLYLVAHFSIYNNT